MPRPPSAHVADVLARLRLRLRDGLHRPGDRFLSNRAVAERFSVSYQTADRLLRLLVAEGLLVRRSGSGTYVPGQDSPSRVHLLFHARARRPDSFGQRLLAMLTTRLDKERVRYRVTYVESVQDSGGRLAEASAGFPVLWECPGLMAGLAKGRVPMLVLNDHPPAGLASVHTDSVALDDFAGGACAADLLRSTADLPRGSSFAVLAGPRRDARSDARVAGFLSVAPARVLHADTWFHESGLAVAPRLLRHKPAALFCCNDRLAQAVLDTCKARKTARPPLVGFDDAPVAESLNLTTIAIPWQDLVTAAVAVVRKRLGGDTSSATRTTLVPRPIIRA